ncbi:Negative elongation factor A [Nymphon striatum]|nr:Negative elongation factor A [Nymphon striatum]
MAHVKDGDVSTWLHNKLGTSNDLWISGSICSQLNKDVLCNIKECFLSLLPPVKTKLLLSFLHLPRRNVEEWKNELNDIIKVALRDSDPWTSVIVELLKDYPDKGVINLDLESNSPVFKEVILELKKQVKKHTNLGMMPLECFYLNKSALNASVGQHNIPIKHFALKRKPKSATLRAELLQKASDSSSNVRKSTSIPAVNSKARGIFAKGLDRRPIKGIPSRSLLSSGFGTSNSLSRLGANGPSLNRSSSLIRTTPAGRKDGGIKLLDINEQPIGFGRDAKRKRKMPEPEPPVAKEKEVVPLIPTATPEYAAGLLQGSKPLTTPTTPLVPQTSTSTSGPNYIPASQPTETITDAPKTTPKEIVPEIPNKEIPITVTSVQNDTPRTDAKTVPPGTTQYTVPAAFSNRVNVSYSIGPTTETLTQPNSPAAITTYLTPESQPKQTIPPPQIVQPAPPPQVKKGLSLTKEQMVEAQEMFRTSNKVTRPEKALILGFMAWIKSLVKMSTFVFYAENPCPNLGSVINITLSENQENVQQLDGTFQNVIAETLFQMNYSTGEWKRIKRYKRFQAAET